jgi:tetratricopeptide repeat protein
MGRYINRVARQLGVLWVTQSQLGLANVYREEGKLGLAEPLYQEVISTREQSHEADLRMIIEPLDECADFLRKANRTAEAQKIEERAKALRLRLNQAIPKQ